MGIEDLETLERFFSASNGLAPVIRYASRYRRKVFIHMFLQQWDREKYANLGLMLYNNYAQALEIIGSLGPAVEDALRELDLSRAQLDELQAEEQKYFRELRDEDPANLHAIAYVELLEEFYKVEFVYSHLTCADDNSNEDILLQGRTEAGDCTVHRLTAPHRRFRHWDAA